MTLHPLLTAPAPRAPGARPARRRLPVRSARPLTATSHLDHRSPALTCRPQLLTPAGAARARGQVEVWRARGELDPETYLDLQRVVAEVEAARD